jgi:hypothetical protein
VREVRLTGKRRGALLREQVWWRDGQVVKYSLAYINPRLQWADNGRILGYDNSHGRHHRHFRGMEEAYEFTSFSELAARFEGEVRELWREEDGEG